MKVLLREDLEKLGSLGEVVDVKNGYARNYLLPRRLAVAVTPENEAQIAKIKKRRAELEEKRKQKYVEQAAELRGKSITIMARVHDEHELYGSVDQAQIAQTVSRDLGYDLEPRDVLLENPIRELGTYDVEIRIYQDVTAALKLYVVAAEE
jgi:large subunit ribosomal protein L9